MTYRLSVYIFSFLLAGLIFVGLSEGVYAQDSCALPEYENQCRRGGSVCGQPPMPKCGEDQACAQVMPEPKTYQNRCDLEEDKAVFLFSGNCDNPPNELTQEPGPAFLTQEEFDQINNTFNYVSSESGESAGFLSQQILSHGPMDFYDEHEEAWQEAIDALRRLTLRLFTQGVLSKGQYFHLAQPSGFAAERLEEYQLACDGGAEMELCKAGLEYLSGLLSHMVISAIPRELRTQHLTNFKNKLMSFLSTQIRAPAGEGESCSLIACQEGVYCALDPTQEESGKLECENHSDCPSGLCEERLRGGTRFCRAEQKCFFPIMENGASCVENPLCGNGLTCRRVDSGLPTCGAERTECSLNSECCSGSCNEGKCQVVRQCLNCTQVGARETRDRPCCDGLISNPDNPGQCIQYVPDHLTYENMIGYEIQLQDQDNPINLEQCEFDWYQSYLLQLKRDPNNFEREMSLLAFEYVAGGDDYVDDFWSVNKDLKSIADFRKQLRSWLLRVLQSDIDNHEEVLTQIGQEVTDSALLREEDKEVIRPIYAEIARTKENYQQLCGEVHDTLEIADEFGDQGVDADGVRANVMAILLLQMEKQLIMAHMELNTSPTFLDLQGDEGEGGNKVEGIIQRLESTDWKRVDHREVFTDKWKVAGWNFLGKLLAYVTTPGLILNVLGVINPRSAKKFKTGQGEAEGVIAALWAEGHEPIVEVENYKKSWKIWPIIRYYHYEITVDWPMSFCPEEPGQFIMAVSGACIKRFLYTPFEGSTVSMPDPFVPQRLTKRDLFYCGNQDQFDFYEMVNHGAFESIEYLLERREPGLDATAVELAFPDISHGNVDFLDPRKNRVKEAAGDYLFESFPDLKVPEEFVTKFSEHVLDLHYIFPNLSIHDGDIGYPKRGMVPYLKSLGMMLSNNIDHNDNLIGIYDKQITEHHRLLCHMVSEIRPEIFGLLGVDPCTGEGEYTDGNPNIIGGGDEGDRRPPVPGSYGQPPSEGSGTTARNDRGNRRSATSRSSGPESNLRFSLNALMNKDQNPLSNASLSGNDQEGMRTTASIAGSSALRNSYENSRRRNTRIQSRMVERTRLSGEDLKKRGGDLDLFNSYYNGLYSSMASPSHKFNNSSLFDPTSVAPQRKGSERSSTREDDAAAAISSPRAPARSQTSARRPAGSARPAAPAVSNENLQHIERSISSVSQNPARFNPRENDGLFEVVTKAYFRNYDRLLERRGARESIEAEIQFLPPGQRDSSR